MFPSAAHGSSRVGDGIPQSDTRFHGAENTGTWQSVKVNARELAQNFMLQIAEYPLETQEETIIEIVKIFQRKHPGKTLNLFSQVVETEDEQFKTSFAELLAMSAQMASEVDTLGIYLNLTSSEITNIKQYHQFNSEKKNLEIFKWAINKFQAEGMSYKCIHAEFKQALIDCGRRDLADQMSL
nr:hypothetical protein [Endozoicomonas sp.]